jgi:hypothetical protein
MSFVSKAELGVNHALGSIIMGVNIREAGKVNEKDIDNRR